MDNEENLGYFSKTVSDRLGISTDTLRSWSSRLESREIDIERNDKNQRIYYEKDIRALEKMKELLGLQQPLNKVAEIISDKIKNGEFDGVESDDNASIMHSVIGDDTALSVREQRLEQQYHQLLTIFSTVTEEYAVTKEKMVRIEDNTEKMLSSMDDMMNELKREKEEKKMFQEKLNIAVNFIQQMEEVQPQKEEKKTFLERLFGR